MKKYFLFVLILCLGHWTALAQSQSTTGAIDGRVLDQAGAALPGAKVIIVGQKGTPTEVSTDAEGYFQVRNLDPGNYSVTVEQQGFKKTRVEKVEVLVGKTSTITANLEVGAPEIEITVTDVGVLDQASTAVSQNLNDQLYQNIPVQRSVSSLFYLSPGATDGLNGGRDNPSISGGSALDNLYVADGVNITDPSFGGIGTFSRVYGALGTGINTSYIKEVQVKTAGFEPQYGQSQGGIINIITKSGSSEYHGAVYGYATPNAFEATYRNADEFRQNKIGDTIARESYDVGADFTGYIPGARNHLFFFGSFNPTIRRQLILGAHRNTFDLEQGTGLDSGIFNILGQHARRYRTWNYAFKLDYNINSNHSLNFSIFGDPTLTNLSSYRTINVDNLSALSAFDFGTRNTAIRYNGAFGSTNPATLAVTFSQGRNRFTESGFPDFNQITDRTQLDATAGNFAVIGDELVPANPRGRGNFRGQGLGFFENTDGTNYRFTIDATKQAHFLGTHTFGIGYNFQRTFYSGLSDRSGPKFGLPDANADGVGIGTPEGAAGLPLNAIFNLRLQGRNPSLGGGCTLCPLMQIPGDITPSPFGIGWRRVSYQLSRGTYGDFDFDTDGSYHAAYVQDTWRFNKYLTVLLGLRWEQERIEGTPLTTTAAAISDLPVGFRAHYTFTGQYAPRIGFTVDPRGQGKTKIYYNFGRYFEYLPLDAAQRSLSIEKDYIGSRFAPAFRIGGPDEGAFAGQRIAILNEFGYPVPQVNNDSLLCGASHGIALSVFAGCFNSFSANDPSNIVSVGTKLGYTDEHVIGFEQQLPRNFTLSVRYIDRRIKRIIEDNAVLPPEAVIANVSQTYVLGNVSSTYDGSVNLSPIFFDPILDADGNILNSPAGCADILLNPQTGETLPAVAAINDPVTGALLGGVCYTPQGLTAAGATIAQPDGVPDGFVDPKRIYKAIEIEVNKRFSNNWQLLSNVRFASLRGNYEGHLRNDNAQTDPGISSLFDFTAGNFNLLGSQFAVGPLPTDRRVIVNIFGSYTFGKEGFMSRLHGMTLGANLHGESGIPISEYFAHPAYLNAGEVPVGGRGKLGRTSPYYRLDLHVDYPYQFSETTRLSFVADFFNVMNNQAIRYPDQFRQLDLGTPNPDFLAPGTAVEGFYRPFNLRLGLRFEF